jgi:hypothetical protein
MVQRRLISLAAFTVMAALLSRCALYTDVAVRPAAITPQQINRGADMQQAIRKHDFIGAVAHGTALAAKAKRSAGDLSAFGVALLACGRYDEARLQLRESIDRSESEETYAQAAWSLSQVEYMQNNYASSLDWARAAEERGLRVRDWHLQYLEALSNVDPYRFTTVTAATVPMKMGKPDVPRLAVTVNQHPVTAIVDSGAVLSIISRQLADSWVSRSWSSSASSKRCRLARCPCRTFPWPSCRTRKCGTSRAEGSSWTWSCSSVRIC